LNFFNFSRHLHFRAVAFAAPPFGGAHKLDIRFRWSTRILNFFSFFVACIFALSLLQPLLVAGCGS
jgi:hypothetical protein